MSGDWRFLLTIPAGWRPETTRYHADVCEGTVEDQFKVTTDGGVWLHPAANELLVRWAVHDIYKVPREALGLPGLGAP